MKVYLHYEGSQGPEFTLALIISENDGVIEILTKFSALYNTKHKAIHPIDKGKTFANENLTHYAIRLDNKICFRFLVSRESFAPTHLQHQTNRLEIKKYPRFAFRER